MDWWEVSWLGELSHGSISAPAGMADWVENDAGGFTVLWCGLSAHLERSRRVVGTAKGGNEVREAFDAVTVRVVARPSPLGLRHTVIAICGPKL